MRIFYAILLGLVQGLTEFLPVSSSGHLVALQEILKMEEASMAFDVVLHLGSLVAVFAFYWNDIIIIINEFFSWLGEIIGLKKQGANPYNRGYRVIMFMLIIASIPTAIIGILFNDLFERMFSYLPIVGFTLLITGVILWISNKMVQGNKGPREITITDAITVGLFQGIAITPGISRSGSTIFAGLLKGFNTELATKFSFLLSIPAILGAAILEGRKVLKLGDGFTDILPMVIGFIVAAISGYFAIRFLVNLINKRKLHYFSYYCWGIGIFILLYSAIFL